MSKKITCVRWRPKGSSWCTELADSFAAMFQHQQSRDMIGDDVCEFQIVEMTQEEFDALPEFEGF